MKRIWIQSFRPAFSRLFLPFVFLLALLLLFSFSSRVTSFHNRDSLSSEKKPVVVVDAGHGGYDPGVKSGAIAEKDLTLTVAFKLKDELEKRKISCLLTREEDVDFAQKGQVGRQAKREDLNWRIEKAAQAHATIFISLHVNSSTLATRGGAEVFYNQVAGAVQLGETIQEQLHQIPGMSKRTAKPETYYLLKHLPIPAVIVEIGYLNLEKNKLVSPVYQQKIAVAIAEGVAKYLRQQGDNLPLKNAE